MPARPEAKKRPRRAKKNEAEGGTLRPVANEETDYFFFFVAFFAATFFFGAAFFVVAFAFFFAAISCPPFIGVIRLDAP